MPSATEFLLSVHMETPCSAELLNLLLLDVFSSQNSLPLLGNGGCLLQISTDGLGVHTESLGEARVVLLLEILEVDRS